MARKLFRAASVATFLGVLLASSVGCQTTGPPLIYRPGAPGFPQPRELTSQGDPEGTAHRGSDERNR